MIRRTLWYGLGFMVALGGGAFAGTAPDADFGRTGWYVGGGGTYAVESVDRGQASGAIDVGNSAGLRVLGGYRAHPNLAAELAVDYLPAFGVDVDGHRVGHVSAIASTLSGKGYLTAGRVQPYGVAGVGALHAVASDSLGLRTSDATGFLARFGGGVDVYATSHVVVNLESSYDLPTGDVSDLRFVPITLGAQYRF